MDDLRVVIARAIERADRYEVSSLATADAVLAAIRERWVPVERRHLERLKYDIDHGHGRSAFGHGRFLVDHYVPGPIAPDDPDLARDAPEGEG